MNEKNILQSTSNKNKDFVFQFKLEDLKIVDNEDNPLINMIRYFINDLQQIGYLCSNGMRIHVDGFVLNNEPEILHNLENVD